MHSRRRSINTTGILVAILLTFIVITAIYCSENQRGDKNAQPSSSWWHNYISPIIRSVFDSTPIQASRRNSFGYLHGRDSTRSHNKDSKQVESDSKAKECQRSRFDRLIEQKWNTSDLSKPIYHDGLFNNPWDTWQAPTMTDAVKFLMTEPDDSHIPAPKEELDINLPILKPKLESPPAGGQFRVTWIGHSTLLIQVDGYNILTDPVFSKRASPVQFIGPARFRDPAITVAELPKIDLVVISHNHYDHLDANSLEALNERFGARCRWLVPRGLGEFMQSSSITNYQELDWWHKDCLPVELNSTQSDSITTTTTPIISNKSTINDGEDATNQEVASKRQLQIYMTPAQHWSRRSVNDVYKSLWGSYTFISSTNQKFFFTGDTGYCPVFKEICKVFGPMNGAAIPIGAYKPRWFAKAIHVDPKDAIKIHRDLKSFKSMAIHWGTFSLSAEHYMEPAKLLQELMLNATDLNDSPFITIEHGASLTFCPSKEGC